MIPTEEQSRAIDRIRGFLNTVVESSDLSTRLLTISGAAGTGKTELIRMIQAAVRKAVICAPTNKAAGVLRRRGFEQATTLDKVINKKIWAPVHRPMTEAEKLYYVENDLPLVEFIVEPAYEQIDNTATGLVVICDEASMTDKNQLARLLVLYQKIIMVGDGFQLPPPDANAEAWFQHV